MTECDCYACTFTYPPGDGWRGEARMATYEECLEAVEAWPHGVEMRISRVWRLHRDNGSHWGPTEWNMLGHVFRDLRAHGLIKCVNKKSGKCYGWLKVA